MLERNDIGILIKRRYNIISEETDKLVVEYTQNDDGVHYSYDIFRKVESEDSVRYEDPKIKEYGYAPYEGANEYVYYEKQDAYGHLTEDNKGGFPIVYFAPQPFNEEILKARNSKAKFRNKLIIMIASAFFIIIGMLPIVSQEDSNGILFVLASALFGFVGVKLIDLQFTRNFKTDTRLTSYEIKNDGYEPPIVMCPYCHSLIIEGIHLKCPICDKHLV